MVFLIKIHYQNENLSLCSIATVITKKTRQNMNICASHFANGLYKFIF